MTNLLSRLIEGHQHNTYPPTPTGTSGPSMLILSCMDARCNPEAIFKLQTGESFVLRIAGNVITPEIIGSMEYAVTHAGIKLIFILGHTDCKAIAATHQKTPMASLHSIATAIQPAIDDIAKQRDPNAPENTLDLDAVSHCHVQRMIAEVSAANDGLRSAIAAGDLTISGGLYDVQTKKVRFI